MTDITLLVCSICKGARWVCNEHPLAPWHLGHLHCESHGTPCTACNHGPEFAPWSSKCLDCTSPEGFCEANPDDDDVLLASMDITLDDDTSLPSLRPEDDMTRCAHIKDHLSATLTRCAAVAIEMDPERWKAATEPGNLRRLYGWVPPYPQTPVGPFVLEYCPEIIDAQTKDLSDDELDQYLEAIGFHASMHIQHHERTIEERELLIDRTLYDIGPGSIALMSQVQLAAMDMRRDNEK